MIKSMLLPVAIVIFTLLLIGIGLTIYEFKSYVFTKEDEERLKKKSQRKN